MDPSWDMLRIQKCHDGGFDSRITNPAIEQMSLSFGDVERCFRCRVTGLKTMRWGFHIVDGWNPANQLRLVVHPIIYEVLYIPGGAGFLPSTVSFYFLGRKKRLGWRFSGNSGWCNNEHFWQENGEYFHTCIFPWWSFQYAFNQPLRLISPKQFVIVWFGVLKKKTCSIRIQSILRLPNPDLQISAYSWNVCGNAAGFYGNLWDFISLSQWLNFKLSGITCLVGTMSRRLNDFYPRVQDRRTAEWAMTNLCQSLSIAKCSVLEGKSPYFR